MKACNLGHARFRLDPATERDMECRLLGELDRHPVGSPTWISTRNAIVELFAWIARVVVIQNCRRPGSEEDMLQECMVELIRLVETRRRDVPFRAQCWVRLRHFVWKQNARRVYRRMRRFSEYNLPTSAAAEPGELDLVARFARLDPCIADVVRRRFGIGRPAETTVKIAQSLGMSYQAVSQKIANALKRMRKPGDPSAVYTKRRWLAPPAPPARPRRLANA